MAIDGAGNPEIEQRRLQGDDPPDQHQQADPHDQRQTETDFPGPGLLVSGQFVRQNGDKHQIIDAEYDFENHESDKRDPG